MKEKTKKAIKAVVSRSFIAHGRKTKHLIDAKLKDRAQQGKINSKLVDLLATAKKIEKNDNPRLIISLTSYGHRIGKTAPLTIASLLNQTQSPDSIVIWLAYSDKPSRALKKLEGYGLHIKYTDDIKSYKKLIPTLKDNPKSIIITVDDDMLYPKNWLEKTLKTYKENPRAIVVNRGKKIIIKNGQVKPYTDWPLLVDNKTNSTLMLPTGAGGVLYPPNSLDSRVVDQSLYMKLAPHADDLWFWAMAELKNTKRVLVYDGFSNTVEYELDNSNDKRLSIVNVDPNNKNNNDAQLAKILNQFPELYNNLKITKKK